MRIETSTLLFLSLVRHWLPVFGFASAILLVAATRAADGSATDSRDSSTGTEWATIAPREFTGAINNPLKGFRDYKKGGYGLLERTYIPWNVIERGADDGVGRIIAHVNAIAQSGGQRFEELNVKLVPRVYLDWDGSPGTPQKPKQHWPADLHTFDYDSPAFQQRLRRLVAKLGEAWDNDPRIFAVQMGLIGHWGEHHTPAPTAEQRRLLTDAFQAAFKKKPVLVRHTDREFMDAGFGIYYDTFANVSREPPHGPKDQFPWQATHVHRDIWKRAPIEGEVEYNWQQQRGSAKPTETFGRTPDETMRVPAYRRYMVDKIRRYHASYLGWINNYNAADREVLAGAAEIQKAFGYRFVLDAVSYPRAVPPGGKLTVKLSVINTGSAPFYPDWPVAVALLDPATRKPVWSAPLNGVDIRKWLPGEDWDSAVFSYRSPAKRNDVAGEAVLPPNLKAGEYILALAILDRQGGMTTSVRFATENYFRGGWHPFGFIGIGTAPREHALKDIPFDNPAFDDSLRYQVPETLLGVKAPPLPEVKAVKPWAPDAKIELINPWRYWNLEPGSGSLEKMAGADGPVDGPAGRRVIAVVGAFGRGSSLSYTFSKDGKLAAGRYRFTCRVRGTAGLSVVFEVADGWRGVSPQTTIPLTSEWRAHVVEFELKNPFEDETRLRFMLPQESNGTFELTDIQLLCSHIHAAPLKVFILAGQSNMVGHGKADEGGNPAFDPKRPQGKENPREIPGGLGSMRAMIKEHPAKFGPKGTTPLVDDKGDWLVRKDVKIYAYCDGTAMKGDLTLGYAAPGAATWIGPEFGFGHAVGNGLADDVLIIKVSAGGTSLAVDWRPPGAVAKRGGEVGPRYSHLVTTVNEVLANPGTEFAAFAGRKAEVAGFGWHQGWQDGGDAKMTAEYAMNMADFIEDARKEFGPHMAFVIANSGFFGDQQKGIRAGVRQAQDNMADAIKRPQFKGNVAVVDTRPMWRDETVSPSSFGYHWNHNGYTHYEMGAAMGEAMLKLMK